VLLARAGEKAAGCVETSPYDITVPGGLAAVGGIDGIGTIEIKVGQPA